MPDSEDAPNRVPCGPLRISTVFMSQGSGSTMVKLPNGSPSETSPRTVPTVWLVVLSGPTPRMASLVGESAVASASLIPGTRSMKSFSSRAPFSSSLAPLRTLMVLGTSRTDCARLVAVTTTSSSLAGLAWPGADAGWDASCGWVNGMAGAASAGGDSAAACAIPGRTTARHAATTRPLFIPLIVESCIFEQFGLSRTRRSYRRFINSRHGPRVRRLIRVDQVRCTGASVKLPYRKSIRCRRIAAGRCLIGTGANPVPAFPPIHPAAQAPVRCIHTCCDGPICRRRLR